MSIVSPTVTLKVSKIDDRFSEYGIREGYLKYMDRDTPFKVIFKRVREEGREVEKPIAIVSRRYRLIPNSLVLLAVRELAGRYKLELDEKHISEALTYMVSNNNHSKKYRKEVWNTLVKKIANRELTVTFDGYYGSRIYINFIASEPIRWSDEVVFPGVQVRNSEDGSLGLGVDILTYRLKCMNGAIFHGRRLPIKVFYKHTRQLEDFDKESLAKCIDEALSLSVKIIKKYRLLAQKNTDGRIIEELMGKISKRYLPRISRQESGELILSRLNRWHLYNYITASIWHTPTDMATKRALYDKLHRIMGLTQTKL